LRRERDAFASENFIKANGIRRGDVEMLGGDGKPWFGIVCDFAKWLKANSTKHWLNGMAGFITRTISSTE
jgi:hypothetical protein